MSQNVKIDLNRREFVKKGLAAGVGVSLSGLLDATKTIGFASQSFNPNKRPNILLLFSDQHNASVLGYEGHRDVITPNLDILAGEGVRFSRAYCQDAVCVPSRTSILTGQYARTTGVLDNPHQAVNPEMLQPLQQVLKDNGYLTAAFGKRHLPKGVDIGFDKTATTLPPQEESSDEYYWNWVREQGQWEEFERDWAAEHGYRMPGKKSAPLCSQLSNLRPENTMEAYTADRTIEFIRESKKWNKPFFCWASFYRPHQPYTPVMKYAEMYDPEKIILPPTLYECIDHLPPELRNLRRNEGDPVCLARASREINLYRTFISYYYALVTEIDDHIGKIMNTLRSEKLDDNTIVIYTSDHGEFAGAHGMIEKCHIGHNIYEDIIRVPLIIRWPGHIRKGMNSKDLVELVDIYPTLLDMCGIERRDNYALPGISLFETMKTETPLSRSIAISEKWFMITAVSDRYKLGVWIGDQSDNYGNMLFDRINDPYETYNLYDKKEVKEIQFYLLKQIEAWVKKTPNVKNIDNSNIQKALNIGK